MTGGFYLQPIILTSDFSLAHVQETRTMEKLSKLMNLAIL